jgi:hypothetical protein
VVSVINSTGSPPHRLSAQGDGRGHSISGPPSVASEPRQRSTTVLQTEDCCWTSPPGDLWSCAAEEGTALSPQLDPLPSGPDVAAPGGEARDSFLLADVVLELPSPSCYSVLPCLVGLRGSNYGATKVGTARVELPVPDNAIVELPVKQRVSRLFAIPGA